MTAHAAGPRGALLARVGGFPRAFWVLWSGTLVNRLGTMVLPFLALYLTGDRGLPVTTAGTVLALLGAGQVFSQVIGGVLADLLGRRAALTGGMLATGAVMVALGYARAVPAVAVLALLLGLSMDLFRPASQAIVADLVPAAERTRAFGLLLWAVNLGFSVSMVLGGTLARSGYLTLFWVDALTGAVFGLLVWRAVPEPDRAPPPAVDGDRRQGLGAVLRDGVLVGVVALTLVVAFVFLQAFATLPLAMRAHGRSPAAYGAVMAVNGLVIVAVQPLLGHRLGRFDPSRALAMGMTLIGVGYGLTWFARSAVSYAGVVVVWTLGEIVVHVVGAAIVADLAPAHLRGRYNGVYGTAWGLGSFAAPLGGTRLFEAGAGVLWTTCLALCVAAAAGQLLLGPAVRRRATHAAGGPVAGGPVAGGAVRAVPRPG